MKKIKDTEIYRIQVFLDSYNSISPSLKELTRHSYKYYQDKLRDLLFKRGTTKHPFPEEEVV